MKTNIYFFKTFNRDRDVIGRGEVHAATLRAAVRHLVRQWRSEGAEPGVCIHFYRPHLPDTVLYTAFLPDDEALILYGPAHLPPVYGEVTS